MFRRIRKPSPAMVVACIALLVALSGTGIAALDQLPRASVGTPQLKRNAVNAQKLAPNAVRSGHVLNGSLLAVDFKEGQIPAGPQGPPGPQGPAGAPATTLWAHVARNGSIVRSSRPGFSATDTLIGVSTVVFPANVSNCTFAAITVGTGVLPTGFGALRIHPPPIGGMNDRVLVQFSYLLLDGGFHIQAFC